jgi:hypothetical protein
MAPKITLTKTLIRNGVMQSVTITNHPVSINEARSQAARLFAVRPDLKQYEVAKLVGRSKQQVMRWCQEPSFMDLIDQQRLLASMPAKDDEDDGGEWSPEITTFHYKKFRR